MMTGWHFHWAAQRRSKKCSQCSEILLILYELILVIDNQIK